MRILFIATSRIPTERAMGTAIMKQCEAFAELGHDVTLIIPKRENAISSDPWSYHGVTACFRIVRLPCIDASQGGRLGHLLRHVTFLLSLCVHLTRYPRTTVLYSREPEILGCIPTRKKKIVELHHLYGLRRVGRFFLSQMAGIITITRALEEDIHSLFRGLQVPTHVSPSGVSLDAFQQTESPHEARIRLGLPPEGTYAFYIGEFDTWKGVQVFLRAHETLIENGITPVVIGGSPEEVATLSREYSDVRFLGRRPQQELPHNQQAADVLVIPNSGQYDISRRYTSPLKVFTAMASGIPIVASRTTAIEEILDDECAYLVTPDDPATLASGIREALAQRDDAERRARMALVRVGRYDWHVRGEEITQFLGETVTFSS